jgi:hypothetical protein
VLGPRVPGKNLLRICALSVFVFFAASGINRCVAARSDDPAAPAPAGAVQIVTHNSYPELRVDGVPFFVHGATFDYFRIPRDLWESSLDRYRELGINTIDLAIPWNWHQPRENEFDFDGHTNPRRDLRSLLRLIAEKKLHLIVRAAPVIRSHWRHGGYPEWLLARPEFKMDASDLAAGRLPPLAAEGARDANAAARGWMDNAAHTAALRVWLTALARELAPYNSSRKVRITEPGEKPEDKHEVEISGPLLFVQLEESAGLDSLHDCSDFWSYADSQRQTLQSGGVEAIYLVNAITSSTTEPACLPPADSRILLTGRWNPASPPQSGGQLSPGLPAPRRITPADASSIDFLAQILHLQSSAPALVSDFQPGTYAPGDDVRPPTISPSNTLLSSRLLFAHGAQGIEYAPLQDTLSPAGYDVPEANRYYRWDAALSLSGRRQPQGIGVARNAQFVEAWGAFLAASHTRADFALAGSHDAAEALARIGRIASLAGFAADVADPDSQPLEVLLRYPAVFLPVQGASGQKIEFSAAAQSKLVEYVRRGGALITFPGRPAGGALEELWRSASPATAGEPATPQAVARFGEGRVIAWPDDLSSGAALEQAFGLAGTQRAVKRKDSGLLISQRISHAGTGIFGERPWECAQSDSVRDSFGPLCNRGVLSVTNLNYEAYAEAQLAVLSPRAGVRGSGDDYLSLDLQVPVHESLLLPLHTPLCGENPGEKCEDEVVIAGAELLRAERDGKALLLSFYTPARATVLVRLESRPAKISIGDINLEGTWTPESHLLEVTLPRGASPSFLRELTIHLKYTPHVPARPDPDKRPRRNFDASVVNAVPLPLGEDASLPSYPPLVLFGLDRKGALLFQAENHDVMGRDLSMKIEGAIRGSGRMGLDGREAGQIPINVSPTASALSGDAGAPPPGSDGLYVSELLARSGRFERRTPVGFVPVGPDLPVLYKFDFDRDAAKEWVLENARLRVIVSPEDGGRALALVDKPTGANLITPISALRDLFAIRTAPDAALTERDITFNRAYAAEQIEEAKKPGLRLRYHTLESEAGGAEIEKTLRIADKDSFEAEYRLSFSNSTAPAPSFVVMTSIPAQVGGERGTQFCWQPPESLPAKQDAATAHCEAFVPGAAPLLLPAGVDRIEIHTPGLPTLAISAEQARLRIEPKLFSALLKFEFPANASAGQTTRFLLRYTILPAD